MVYKNGSVKSIVLYGHKTQRHLSRILLLGLVLQSSIKRILFHQIFLSPKI